MVWFRFWGHVCSYDMVLSALMIMYIHMHIVCIYLYAYVWFVDMYVSTHPSPAELQHLCLIWTSNYIHNTTGTGYSSVGSD